MTRLRLSTFTLVFALPIVAAPLLLILSNYLEDSRPVRWADFDRMPKELDKSDGIYLVSYYLMADPITMYHHRWASEWGAPIIRRYGIQPYALDMATVGPEQEAALAHMFGDVPGLTGLGILDLRGDQPRSTWNSGGIRTKEEFEQWIVEFVEAGGP